MNKPLRRTVQAVAVFLLAGIAHADYLWIQQEGGQAVVRAGELHKPLSRLPSMQDAKALSADGSTVPVEAAGDRFVLPAPATGSADRRFTATRPGANGVLTYYQARSGRTETQAVNDLELVPTTPGGNTFKLMFKGRSVAASQANVETSEGWSRTLTPAKDGTITLAPSFPGLYVVEITARVDNGSVALEGTTYNDVRHTATLSFEVRN